MKKRALFIDRDGTIIVEPTDNFQIDSLQKLEFLPKVIFSLARIARKLPFELVMVTNQDGLGTPSLPEENFWPPHLKMMKTLETEDIRFANVHIDKSFEHENLPTRKPGIGMLTGYLEGDYDLANSYVIGDRLTDVQLAENLGAKSILYGGKHDTRAALCTSDWEAIYLFLKADCQSPQDGWTAQPDEKTAEPGMQEGRRATVQRKTNETDISVSLQLDSKGESKINTGIGFFDHMLEQLAKHSGAQLHISVKGDLHIDEHHTIEDLALALGEAYLKALGDKKGISRYGHFLLPMDETLAQVAIDFSGRPWMVWNAEFRREKVGGMPAEMFMHFFKSFSDTAKCNLNIKVEGDNEHHKIEALFKAFARAIRMAVKREKGNNEIPSTKGVL